MNECALACAQLDIFVYFYVDTCYSLRPKTRTVTENSAVDMDHRRNLSPHFIQDGRTVDVYRVN
jgi:hypothetical protein